MAVLDETRTLYQCPACHVNDFREYGQFQAVEIDGRLFAADPAGLELPKTSRKFEEYSLMHCDGSISRECLKEFIQLELLEPTSPLSMLITRRIRALKCPHCGYLTKLSRLP